MLYTIMTNLTDSWLWLGLLVYVTTTMSLTSRYQKESSYKVEEEEEMHALIGEKSLLLDPKAELRGVELILQQLTEHEKHQLADENMPLRHLRAEKGDVVKAVTKLKSTIKWRHEFGVEHLKHCFNPQIGDAHLRNIILEENATGKIYCRGYDYDGRVCMYMRPGRENTNHEENNMLHLVYNLERAIACTMHKSGHEKINLIIDYHGFKLKDAPPMRVSKNVLNILQDHYPERMYRAYVCNPPTIFKTFWMLIKPFVDPHTKEKVVFASGKSGLKKIEKNFDINTLEECAMGPPGALREFDSHEYLCKLPFYKAFDEDV